MKKGVYFTLDGIFAALIITSALVLLLTFSRNAVAPDHVQTTSMDAVAILNTLTLSELNTSESSQVIATNLTSENETVLRTIAVLWATNNTLAQSFTASVFQTFLPQYSYAVYAEDQLLYSNSTKPESSATHIAAAKQEVSGIAEGKPVSGSTAVAFLRKVENKSTSSYAYFGGFVGQGNLTFTMQDLPSDINSTNVRDVYLELDTPAGFELWINGHDCGSYLPIAAGNLTPDAWTVIGCNNAFIPASNIITLNFTGAIDTAYVSGGLLRVRYVTGTEIPNPYSSPRIATLPGIRGIVNLYDSFYVPGAIANMTVYLHYLANHTGAAAGNNFYLTIGNVTVYRDNSSNTTQVVTLQNVNLSQLLNYSEISGHTVPIRLGFENLSFNAIYTGNANVMLITDVSGSMAWRMDNNNNGVIRNCTNSQLNSSDTARISVAKCLDTQFSTDILNVSGNTLGLVNFSTSTEALVQRTANITLLNNSINQYTPDANTCICCGIINATNELSKGLLKTYLVVNTSSWKYFFANGSLTPPANDSDNHAWYSQSYTNESTWNAGAAVLGSNDNGSSPAVVTDMGNTITTVFVYHADLWDMSADNATASVDFTSGMNSTANTFGYGNASDGWDWQAGTYDFASNQVAFPGAVNGAVEIDFNTTNNRNNCASNDCSGAYGVSVNITPAMWSVLQQKGSARVAFTYAWQPIAASSNLNNADELWIKARFWQNGTAKYLGSELSSAGNDNTFEVASEDNPAVPFNGSFTQDITSYINGPGLYYLDLGGKLLGNSQNDRGVVRIDNVFLGISNQTDVYYLRQNFTVTNLSQVQSGMLNLLSDDRATVYLNGVLLLDEALGNSATYWNERGFAIPQQAFVQGTNTLAVRLENTNGPAKFSLELYGLNTTRTAAMLTMTDGVANVRCYGGGGDALSDAVQAACFAKQNWGITVHAVGFSQEADNATLQAVAACGGGLYTSSSNTSDLTDFYKTVAISILDASVRSQSVVVQNGFQQSTLYPDSYLSFDYAPAYAGLQQNEISVRTQTQPFNSCTPSVFINPQARILTAQLTSYSGEHWTYTVGANGNTVYDLSNYSTPFLALGDPFVIDLPAAILQPGSNSLSIQTADSPTNLTGCSANDTLITTLAVALSTPYTPVLVNTTGCTWTIEHDDHTTQVVPVPASYIGARTCTYTNSSITYDPTDAYDAAVYSILTSLDYDRDGRIFISLAEEDLEIIVTKVSNVPYLWGPSLIEVRAWQ